MQIAIISDIHGNPNFCEAVKGPEFIICLGDYVGTSGENPDSNKCIALCRRLKGHFLIGNHDIEALQSGDEESELTFVKDGIEYGSDFGLSKGNKDWLRKTKKSVRTRLRDRHLLFIHSYLKEGYFHYLDTQDVIYEFIETVKEPDGIIFVGHTHVPEVYLFNKDGMLVKRPISYKEWMPFDKAGKYLVNVGSTGDPRDGKKTGTYVIFDTERLAVKFCEVPNSMGLK